MQVGSGITYFSTGRAGRSSPQLMPPSVMLQSICFIQKWLIHVATIYLCCSCAIRQGVLHSSFKPLFEVLGRFLFTYLVKPVDFGLQVWIGGWVSVRDDQGNALLKTLSPYLLRRCMRQYADDDNQQTIHTSMRKEKSCLLTNNHLRCSDWLAIGLC